MEGDMIDEALRVCLLHMVLRFLYSYAFRSVPNSEGYKISSLCVEVRTYASTLVSAPTHKGQLADPPRGAEYWIPTDPRFVHAKDLVAYIRAEPEYASYFGVGVAGVLPLT